MRQAVSEALQEPDFEWIMTDSTVIRAHQQAAGQKKTRQGDEAVGKSKGGKSTKVYASVDALGNPRRLILTSEQAHDVRTGSALIEVDATWDKTAK